MRKVRWIICQAPAAALGSDGVVPQRQRRPERSTVRGPGGSAGGRSGTSRAVPAFARGRRGDQCGFCAVPVPAGLADRVSRRLAEAAPSGEQGAGSETGELRNACGARRATSAVTLPDWPAPLREPAERFSRRRLLVGFAALSAAAALLAAVWIQTHPPRHDTPDSVLEEAMDFFGKDNQPFGEFVSQVAPPAEYPMSPTSCGCKTFAGDMSRSFWAVRRWPTICPRSAAGPRSMWSRGTSPVCRRFRRMARLEYRRQVGRRLAGGKYALRPGRGRRCRDVLQLSRSIAWAADVIVGPC